MLEDRSPAGREAWREGMQALAAQPNVVAKLSGLGTFIHRNDPEHIDLVVNEALDLFGPERCMFGSNFPIEKLWTSYPKLLDAYRAALEPYSRADQSHVLHDTAARVYRLDKAAFPASSAS
jgi:predicted TIM-barrel fold metal-dependent hydrolase